MSLVTKFAFGALFLTLIVGMVLLPPLRRAMREDDDTRQKTLR